MNNDYFAVSAPRVYQYPAAYPSWPSRPDSHYRARQTAGQVLAVIAGCIAFVTVVVPTVISFAIGLMIIASGGITF